MTSSKQNSTSRTWVLDMRDYFQHVWGRSAGEHLGWLIRKGPVGLARSGSRFARFLLGTYADRQFDRVRGTDTGGYTAIDQLDVDESDQETAFEFVPTPVKTFRHLMQQVDGDLSNYTFVDYGSGKGRTLIVAAELGFKRSVGVEFSAQLATIANQNAAHIIKNRLPAAEIHTVCEDAASFDVPAGPCVLYFYAPFTSPILDRVIERIKQSYQQQPRPMYLIYADYLSSDYPIPTRVLERTGFQLITAASSPWDPAAVEPTHYVLYRSDAQGPS